jgi:Transposase
MPYRIAGIDVHKKMLAVVVSDVEIESEYQFERRKFGSNPEQLRSLAAWLLEQEAEEVVMESTAQYWKPVWEALERYWKPIREKREGARRKSGTLHLAQAESNRGRRGRKRDFPDAERLVKRLVSRELTLSFVPDAEQRLWRTVTRRKYQLTRDHVRLQNQLDGAGAVAIPRAADRPAGPGDGQSAQPAPGCRPATGGSAGSGSGFSAADHRRSRSHRSDLSLGEMSLFLGGCMPRRRRERGRELQPPVSEGQPPHAARSQPGGQCRSQG